MKTSKEVSSLVDHFFRNEFSKAVAFLTNKYGAGILELAEDAVQEALFKAMQSWPYKSVPDNPTGWIIKVASNKILDHLRRSKKISYTEQIPDHNFDEFNHSEEAFKDDMIKMMFACCNPHLSSEYQIILTLKILGGLSIKEMASALLKKEATIAKSYTRAKLKFREQSIKMELPNEKEINDRLLRVLKVIYLLFNEGYKSTNHDDLIRQDLCLDAIRLCELLIGNKATNTAHTRSLLALMFFHSSRFGARIDSNGKIIPMEKQNRKKWVKEFIEKGNHYLASVTDNELKNEYFLQAAISGVYCNANSFEETRWDIILHLYDNLLALNQNPIVALNRIVAFEKINGAEKAMEELIRIEENPYLAENHLLFVIKSEILLSLKQTNNAKKMLKKAMKLTSNKNEQTFLKEKLESINS